MKGERMQAFHNDPKIKQKYLRRVRAHAKADEIIKGKYWEKGKGCAVGCTIHSGEHKRYETELGIPQWLARLEDQIFEGLPQKEAMKWPVQFLKAIKTGSFLEKIKIPMLIFIAESAREKTKNKKSLAAIDGVLLQLKKDVLDLPALREARGAAYAAAAAAYAVAEAVAEAAAYAAAYAAAAADAAYARENEYVKFADKLLELIKNCT